MEPTKKEQELAADVKATHKEAKAASRPSQVSDFDPKFDRVTWTCGKTGKERIGRDATFYEHRQGKPFTCTLPNGERHTEWTEASKDSVTDWKQTSETRKRVVATNVQFS